MNATASEYLHAAMTSFKHGVTSMAVRRRTHVAAALVCLPALLPLAVLIHVHGDNDVWRGEVLTEMIETFYIGVVTPLLALFFATMIVGEDVESRTISYILTRPVPRPAWIIGRFAAYVLVTSALVFAAIIMLWFTTLAFPRNPQFDVGGLLLFRYQMVATFSLLGYGALCLLLGAWLRHPVIVAILLIFPWQRGAALAPGAADFFTIEKYVVAILPDHGRNVIAELTQRVSEMYRAEIVIGPVPAAAVLILFTMLCVALTNTVVKRREYTLPTAVTE